MDKIDVAFIRKPQGIKGDIKIEVLLDNKDDISKLTSVYIQNDDTLRKVEKCYKVGGEYALKIEGINSVESALQFKNRYIEACREDVDKLKNNKDFYIADLLHKQAKLDTGEVLGTIEDIENYGANDVVYISSKKYPNLAFANIGGIILKVEDNCALLSKNELEKVWVYDEDEN